MISEKRFRFIVDLLFPVFCLNCKQTGTYACDHCLRELEILKLQVCPGCRKCMERGEFCSKKCHRGFHFDQLIVGMGYDKESFLKKLIVRFKYKFSEELADTLASVLIAQTDTVFGDFEDCRERIMVVPVPLHISKMRQRGFNQARLLAERIANYFGLEMVDCLLKLEQRKDQAKLGRQNRLENLRGIFALAECYKPARFKEKIILLVDDVATTGSTLNECGKILKKAGAGWICGVVIARGK